MLTCKLSNVINLTCEIFLEFYLAFSGYRIFFHVSANVQFPSRVSIHLPTQSIDEVSSTCSFHRSFNQNGKLVELVQFSTRPLIKSHFETTSDRFLRFHHFRFHIRFSNSSFLEWISFHLRSANHANVSSSTSPRCYRSKTSQAASRSIGEIDRFSREESFGRSRYDSRET